MIVRVHPQRTPLRADAALRVPGDKSLSHRALILAALAEGESRIAGLAPGHDVRSTARCLAQLGVPLRRGDGTPWAPPAPQRPEGAAALPEADPDMGPDDAIVLGQGLRGLRAPRAGLDCGNSGTTLRLLCGVLAGAGIEAELSGDASLSRRPMERVAQPLRAMGASIETTAGTPPVRVGRGAVRAVAHRSALASAQVKSAVLLAGLFAEGETSFTEPARSRDHTERLLRAMGAPLSTRGTTASVRGPARLSGLAFDVPGDLSSAAFLLAAALLGPPGSRVSLDHVGVNPTRLGFLDALAFFGARLELKPPEDAGPTAGEPVAQLAISAQKLAGAELDGGLVLRAIDEVPLLAVLGAVASGTTTLRGAAELRVKESDRLAQMALGLRACGVPVDELPDGLVVHGRGGRLRGGARVDAAHDHRIALSFAVAALAAEEPVEIAGAEWADVSYPGFFELLERLGARVDRL